eukprot:gene3949-4573_t
MRFLSLSILLFTLLFIHSNVLAHTADTSVNIVSLDSKNIDQYVNRGIWILCFYAPWCKHSKSFEPVFEELSTLLKGHINFGRVDCISDPAMLHRFNVVAYPTIKLYFDGNIYDYAGERTVNGIVQFLQTGYQTATMKPYPSLSRPNPTGPEDHIPKPVVPHTEGTKLDLGRFDNVPTTNNNATQTTTNQMWAHLAVWKESKLAYALLGGVGTACALMIKKRITKKTKFMKIA